MKTRTISSTVLVLDAQTVAKIVKMELVADGAVSALMLLTENGALNSGNEETKELVKALSDISGFMSELSSAILPPPERPF